MIEVSISMRGHDRVAAFTRQHAARQMARTRVQILSFDSLEHDLVEVDAWNHEAADRRSVGGAG